MPGRPARHPASQVRRQEERRGSPPSAGPGGFHPGGPSKAPKSEVKLKILDRQKAVPAAAPLISPRDALARLPSDFGEFRKEHFLALYLNVRRELLCRETVSIGTLTQSLVHPREVFYPAILHGAASLIVAHNHPSGDPSPSGEDVATTERLKEAGKLLGIPLDDHIIAARSSFFSFRMKGLLP